MKKIVYSFLLISLLLIALAIIYLSTVGVETSKFNNIIINEVKKKDSNVQLSLNKIKIKFDLEKIQIYLSTIKPNIDYQGMKIPITDINIYLKLSSILMSNNEINRLVLSLENFSIKDIQKLAIRIKPSNFKTYLLNNLDNGKIKKILIDVNLDKDLNISDYKINGSVKKIDVKISDDLLIQNVNLNFISDKNLTLINSINANYKNILVSNGSLSLNKKKILK